MNQVVYHSLRTYVSFAGVAALLTATAAEAQVEVSDVVDRLRENEQRVETISAEYQITMALPDNDHLDRVERVLAAQGRLAQADRYIVAPEVIEAQSTAVRWMLEGVRERADETYVARGNMSRATAFDGQLVRDVQTNEDETPVASIELGENHRWRRTERITPSFLALKFIDTAYSDVLEEGQTGEARQLVVGDNEAIEVTAIHPRFASTGFRMIVGHDGRVYERRLYRITDSDEWQLREIHEFLEYEQVDGVTLPIRVRIRHTVGTDEDDIPAVYRTADVTIDQIAVNEDIPDEAFVLEIPENARLWDGVGGLGWVDEHDRRLGRLLEDGIAEAIVDGRVVNRDAMPDQRNESETDIEPASLDPKPIEGDAGAGTHAGWLLVGGGSALLLLGAVGFALRVRRNRAQDLLR